MRSPRRRFARVSCTREGTLLLAILAERLGERVGREPTRLASWRALERAIRLASLQGMHVVLGIDDCHFASPGTRRDIESLAGIGLGSGASTLTRRSSSAGDDPHPRRDDRWAPAIGLEALTRSEAETLLASKLAAAGCRESPFSARAITRLHCHCAGVPRAVQQLATHCLIDAANRGLEMITPELVDGLAEEANGQKPSFLGQREFGQA